MVSEQKNETILLKSSAKELILRNGYSSNAPAMTIRALLLVGQGMEKWRAKDNTVYFVLHILEIKNITM